MRIKLGIVAVAVGTVAAATATAALASPGTSMYPAPAQTTPTPSASAHGKPTHTASSGYGHPVSTTSVPTTLSPTTPAPTVSWHSKPAHMKPASIKPASIKPTPSTPAATGTPTPGATSHSVPGYSKPTAKKMIKLTAADNGKTIHVARGKQIVVKLVVKVKQNPDSTTWWQAVTESGDALKALSPALIAHPGVTEARYHAITTGEATLSSSRTVCPHHSNKPTCHSMQGWQVTVDVR